MKQQALEIIDVISENQSPCISLNIGLRQNSTATQFKAVPIHLNDKFGKFGAIVVAIAIQETDQE
jgi:hypothetical protein